MGLAPHGSGVADAVQRVQGPAEHRRVTRRRPQGADGARDRHGERRGTLVCHVAQHPVQGGARLGGRPGRHMRDQGVRRRRADQTDERDGHEHGGQQGEDRVVRQRRGPVRHVVVPHRHRRATQRRPQPGPGHRPVVRQGAVSVSVSVVVVAFAGGGGRGGGGGGDGSGDLVRRPGSQGVLVSVGGRPTASAGVPARAGHGPRSSHRRPRSLPGESWIRCVRGRSARSSRRGRVRSRRPSRAMSWPRRRPPRR